MLIGECSRTYRCWRLDTIQNGLTVLLDYGIFKYNYKPTAQEASHIKQFFDTAVADQRLLRGYALHRSWVGFVAVSRMIRSFLEYNLIKGTYSWDHVISKYLSITLISALWCRAGDVGRTRGYKGSEFLHFREVELYIDGARLESS